jgi:hypothetical protein
VLHPVPVTHLRCSVVHTACSMPRGLSIHVRALSCMQTSCPCCETARVATGSGHLRATRALCGLRTSAAARRWLPQVRPLRIVGCGGGGVVDAAVFVAAGSADFTVKVWNAITGECTTTLDHGHMVKSVNFSKVAVCLCHPLSLSLSLPLPPPLSPSLPLYRCRCLFLRLCLYLCLAAVVVVAVAASFSASSLSLSLYRCRYLFLRLCLHLCLSIAVAASSSAPVSISASLPLSLSLSLPLSPPRLCLCLCLSVSVRLLRGVAARVAVAGRWAVSDGRPRQDAEDIRRRASGCGSHCAAARRSGVSPCCCLAGVAALLRSVADRVVPPGVSAADHSQGRVGG